jgi:hypothetical protein
MSSTPDQEAVARLQQTERDLGRVAPIDTPVKKRPGQVHNMASRLPKPVTSTATMTTRATRSKTVTPSDPAPATATRTTRAAAMKPRDPPAPAKKTAARKTTKTVTKDGEGPPDTDTAATKKAPAATSKQPNGSQPVVVPPDHDIEPIKVSALRIRSHPAAQLLVSGVPSYSSPDNP